MGTLVIKNLPEPLHDKLRAQAARNHRSLTKEVLHVLESSVADQRQGVALPPAPRIKRRGALSIEDIEAAIEDGRYSHYRSLGEVNAWVDELRQDRDVDA